MTKQWTMCGLVLFWGGWLALGCSDDVPLKGVAPDIVTPPPVTSDDEHPGTDTGEIPDTKAGTDSDSGDAPDTGTDTDTGDAPDTGTDTDTGDAPDTETDAPASCDHNGLDALVEDFINTRGDPNTVLFYWGSTKDTQDRTVEIWLAVPLDMPPGNYDLSLLATGIEMHLMRYDAGGDFLDEFAVVAGSAEVRRAQSYVIDILDVVLRDVRAWSLGEMRLPDPEGETWCIDEFTVFKVSDLSLYCEDDGDCAAPLPVCGHKRYCVPSADWDCGPELFGDGDCDCGCGFLDVDCGGDTSLAACVYDACLDMLGTPANDGENWRCDP